MDGGAQEYGSGGSGRNGPRPRRPLLAVGVALALGSLAGGLGTTAAWAAAALASLVWWRAGPAPWLMLCCLAGLRTAVSLEEPADPATGTWSVVRRGERTVGRLHPRGTLWSVDPGLIAPGERVRVLTPRPPVPAARGPVLPASAWSAPRRLLPDEVQRLGPPSQRPRARLARRLASLRDAALERLAGLADPSTRGLCTALLLGERGALPPSMTDLFTRTGTRHLLAVSGLHVGLIALLFVWPAGALAAACAARGGRGSAAGRVLAAPEAWRAGLLALFAPLAGAGAPVVRASLALALGQLAGRLGGRRPDGLSLWALAAGIELLVHPTALESASVLLSYAAAGGLVWAGGSAIAAVRALLPGGGRIAGVGRLGRRRPLWGRVLAQRLLDGFTGGVGLSIAATLATLPFVWTRFCEWSWVGILLTPLMLPWVALLLAAGWLWLLVPLDALESLARAATAVLVGLAEFGDGLPATPAPLAPRPFPLLAAACLGSLALLRGVRLGRPSFLAWALLLAPWTRGPRGLEVRALDVGNGTAVCVRAPGEACWVFDAGSRDRPGVARAALAPALAAWDVGSLAVVLSHPHRDHDGALDWVVERYPPRAWAGALPGRLAGRLPAAAERADLERGSLRLLPGDPGGVGLGLTLLRGRPGDGNEGSRSLRVEWGAERILLCGDADAEGLADLLAHGEADGPHARLLLPHHGADSDWLGPLLAAADPREVWISASGVPPAVEEVERRAIPWSSTAADGPLLYAEPVASAVSAVSAAGAPKRPSKKPRKP
ncbi:MAG: ComEC/Rec2 family competence protein [Planctomycetota bacterium]|nr:ComEC/Rec2 family competence protein [Planctomycetota bacterium]